MGISLWHLLVVVLVIILLFGPGRLPRAMEDVAKGLKSFRRGLKDEDDTDGRKERQIEHSRDGE